MSTTMTCGVSNVTGHPASELRARIYTELAGATEGAFQLEQSWMRLGKMLSDFKANEYWRDLGYQTLDEFMLELRERFQRGRTQLWGYMGVAEKLLPSMSAETLEEIGISKALELKRAMKKLDGKEIPAEIIEAAKDRKVTGKELRGMIGKALHLAPDDKGTWFDLDGFFMTPDERAEFKEAFKASEGLLALSKELPDHIRRKEVILTWMREWFGTHATEFYGPKTIEGNTDGV